MLLIFRPYKVEDFIDTADQFGNVTHIDIFTTILLTFDNQEIIIPNGMIWGKQTLNHSYHDICGINIMTFSIAYNENTEKAKKNRFCF